MPIFGSSDAFSSTTREKKPDVGAVPGMGMKTTPGRTTRADVDLRGLLGMSPAITSSVARQIGSLFDGGSVAGMSDRQLIERFNNERESTGEAAFAALCDLCDGE
jgi:hypothetical protein